MSLAFAPLSRFISNSCGDIATKKRYNNNMLLHETKIVFYKNVMDYSLHHCQISNLCSRLSVGPVRSQNFAIELSSYRVLILVGSRLKTR